MAASLSAAASASLSSSLPAIAAPSAPAVEPGEHAHPDKHIILGLVRMPGGKVSVVLRPRAPNPRRPNAFAPLASLAFFDTIADATAHAAKVLRIPGDGVAFLETCPLLYEATRTTTDPASSGTITIYAHDVTVPFAALAADPRTATNLLAPVALDSTFAVSLFRRDEEQRQGTAPPDSRPLLTMCAFQALAHLAYPFVPGLYPVASGTHQGGSEQHVWMVEAEFTSEEARALYDTATGTTWDD